MHNNIYLAYFLVTARFAWFWLGIWVLFYLLFTNYTGIGIIETALFLFVALAEIPTGAVADLLGKKKTLLISFALQTIGGLMMALAGDLSMLVWSVIVGAFGNAFYSGTIEALIYDSLKEQNQKDKFDKVIANTTSISFLVPAVCSVIGGFLYAFEPRLPFILTAFVLCLATLACFWLKEPKIDTEKFSWSNFLTQTKQGFNQLTRSKEIVLQVLILSGIGTIMVIAVEMLDGILSIEFGYDEQQLGILWAIIFVVAAGASQLTPQITKWEASKAFLGIGILIAISMLISPWLGFWLGGLILLTRACLDAIYRNVTSVYLNGITESKYRATTLSTFGMIKSLPYALSALLIGYLADLYSGAWVAAILGLLLVAIVILGSWKIRVNTVST